MTTYVIFLKLFYVFYVHLKTMSNLIDLLLDFKKV